MYRLIMFGGLSVAVLSLVGLWVMPLAVGVVWLGVTSVIGWWVLLVQVPDSYAGYIAAESRRIGGR